MAGDCELVGVTVPSDETVTKCDNRYGEADEYLVEGSFHIRELDGFKSRYKYSCLVRHDLKSDLYSIESRHFSPAE